MNTSLPAGRDLDERVAIEVMGLVWMASPGQENGHDCIVHADDANAFSKRGYRQRRSDSTAPRIAPPPFSTNIAAAWTIVEHLVGRGWWCNTSLIQPELPDNAAVCRFWRDEENGLRTFATAATMPHAIALAAIQAAALERATATEEATP